MSKTNGSTAEVSFLPVPLEIEVRGEVVASNADAFRLQVKEWISGFNIDLVEDEDFARAEQDVKLLQDVEGRVRDAKEKALADAEQLHALFSLLDETSEEVRQARLSLDKQVKAKKAEIKASIVDEAVRAIPNDHGRYYRGEIENAIKGKRTLDSMRVAVGVVVTTATAVIEGNAATLDAFEKKHGGALIPDRDTLERSQGDTLLVELRRRIETKKAEEERKRLEAEARAARAELEAQKEAQRQAQAEAEAKDAPAAVVEDDVPPSPEGLFDAPVANGQAGQDDGSEEMETFRAAVLEAFRPLKAARAALKHPGNVEKAARFAEVIGAAWVELHAAHPRRTA